MARKNDCWGIEVGQYAIKAMRLTRSGNNVELADWDYLPFKQVLSTPDINVDEAIQVGLDTFMTKHPDFERSQIVVSVPGHLAFARFAKLPPVEPKKIPSIVGYEAQQQIPFPIDQVEWDYQVFQQADSPDVEVGIFAITKERVMEFLSNYRQQGLRIDALTLSPLAVYNAFAFDNASDEDELRGAVYMDIGTVSTDVVIVESGGIWLRTLPIGGNHFTEALVKAFKISFDKAERYKREAATSKYSRQIFSAMRPVFADLVQEIQRSIGYYQSLNRDAELTQIVCVGSTFKLPGLGKFLKQQLGLTVVRPDSFKRLDVAGKQEAEFSTRVLNLATAYGLALQGLGLEKVSANILPGYIIRQRVWKAKQPWIAAAAACVALGSGLAGGRYFMEQSTFDSGQAATDQHVRPIESRATDFRSQQTEIKGAENIMRLENMRRILDYRNIWPMLLADITAANLATKPQAETLEPRYDVLSRIPRAQRRRLYIDRIDTQYLVGPEYVQPGAAPAYGGRTGSGAAYTMTLQQIDMMQLGTPQNIDTFWSGAAGAAPAEATDPAMMDPMMGGPGATGAVASGSTIPRIRVTITGTTPYQEASGGAARFLTQTFLGYLVQHAKQKDRPYQIVLGDKPIVSLERVPNPNLPGSPGYNPAARGAAGARRGTTPTMPGRMPYNSAYGAEFYEGAEFMDMGMGMPGRGGGMGINTAMDALFPERPLIEENNSADSQFVLQFTVELLKPEEARKTEPFDLSGRQLPATPAEQPAEPAPPAARRTSPANLSHDEEARS